MKGILGFFENIFSTAEESQTNTVLDAAKVEYAKKIDAFLDDLLANYKEYFSFYLTDPLSPQYAQYGFDCWVGKNSDKQVTINNHVNGTFEWVNIDIKRLKTREEYDQEDETTSFILPDSDYRYYTVESHEFVEDFPDVERKMLELYHKVFDMNKKAYQDKTCEKANRVKQCQDKKLFAHYNLADTFVS